MRFCDRSECLKVSYLVSFESLWSIACTQSASGSNIVFLASFQLNYSDAISVANGVRLNEPKQFVVSELCSTFFLPVDFRNFKRRQCWTWFHFGTSRNLAISLNFSDAKFVIFRLFAPSQNVARCEFVRENREIYFEFRCCIWRAFPSVRIQCSHSNMCLIIFVIA